MRVCSRKAIKGWKYLCNTASVWSKSTVPHLTHPGPVRRLCHAEVPGAHIMQSFIRQRSLCQKTDGATDYKWNKSEEQNVMCILTSNNPIVYVSGGSVNRRETEAWNQRFGCVFALPATSSGRAYPYAARIALTLAKNGL